MSPEQKAFWVAYLKQLSGKTIKSATVIDVGFGWLAPVITFTDGTFIEVWCDEEGNGPGVVRLYDDATGNEIRPIPKPTAAEIAAKFGCTVEQVDAQRAKNKATLVEMYEKALRTGRKVNGYTADQLGRLIDGINSMHQ